MEYAPSPASKLQHQTVFTFFVYSKEELRLGKFNGVLVNVG
jgi:hypothetical protein